MYGTLDGFISHLLVTALSLCGNFYSPNAIDVVVDIYVPSKVHSKLLIKRRTTFHIKKTFL